MERRVEAAALLGVAFDAAEAEIMRAWRLASREAHPDHGGSEDAFQEVTDARDVLLEPLPIEAAAPKPEVAAARVVRPELGPLRVGLLVFTPPLACAVVIVAYVLAPGVGIALVTIYVAGVVAHAVYTATGHPPLWRWMRRQARRELSRR